MKADRTGTLYYWREVKGPQLHPQREGESGAGSRQ